MENLNKGLLKLINKSKEKELSSFENWRLNNALSNYLIEVIPKTTSIIFIQSEGLNLSEIKEQLSQKYYEVKQIPDKILESTLNKMRKVDFIHGRYGIVKENPTYLKKSISFI